MLFALDNRRVKCKAPQGMSCLRRRSFGEGASEVEWIDNHVQIRNVSADT
jgi:hypothetical protein